MWIDHIAVGEKDECWSYSGVSRTNGYPVAHIGGRKGRTRRVHRLVAEVAYGSLEGPVHHTCENKECVNPLHLLPTTNTKEHRKHHLKEKCIRGHSLDVDVYITPAGKRQCRECRRIRRRG